MLRALTEGREAASTKGVTTASTPALPLQASCTGAVAPPLTTAFIFGRVPELTIESATTR